MTQLAADAPPMMREEYGVMARFEDGHWWYRGLRRQVLDALRRHRPVGRIVDAGCGTGGCYRAIRASFPAADYIGIDVAPEALRYCRERGGPPVLVQASVNQLPIRQESADVILCLDVLYFASVSPAAALRQFRQALKPGGIVIANLPAFGILRGRHDDAVGISRRFRRAEARALFEQAGLRQVHATYWNAVLFVPLLIWRWLSRLSRRTAPASDLSALPGWTNGLLAALIRFEAGVGRWIRLPVGSSLFFVAQKV